MVPIVDVIVSASGVPVLKIAKYNGVLDMTNRSGPYLTGPGFQPFVGKILSELGPHTLTSRCREHLHSLEASVNPFSDLNPVYPPYEHQVVGLGRMVQRPRMAVFWEPGLGKTYVSCSRILHLRKTNTGCLTVILALRVNLTTWEREMRVHSRGSEECRIIKGSNKSARKKKLDKAVAAGVAAIVITYESARSSLEDILGMDYLCVIADECHKLQSPKSGITKAALKISEKSHYRYVLTGTPTKGRPTDSWGYLRFLGSFVVDNYWKFYQRHVSTSPYNKHIITGYRNIKKLNYLLDSVSHSVKNVDAVDLPDRTFQVVDIIPTRTTRILYNKIALGEDEAVVVAGETVDVSNPVVSLNKLCQVSSGFLYKGMRDPTICDGCPHLNTCVLNSVKPYTSDCQVQTKAPPRKTLVVGTDLVDSAIELLQSHISAGKKVILWARYQHTLQALVEKAESSKIKVFRYDSTISNHGEVEEGFNAHQGACTIIAQVSMGIGVTFKGSIMIYTELPMGLDQWLQSLDRNWGIRAKGLGNMLVQVLIIPGSVYAGVYKMLQEKIDAARIMADRPDCLSCSHVVTCTAPEPFKGDCVFTDRIQKNTLERGFI